MIERCPVCEYPSDALPSECSNCHSDLSALLLVRRLGESGSHNHQYRRTAVYAFIAVLVIAVTAAVWGFMSLRNANARATALVTRLSSAEDRAAEADVTLRSLTRQLVDEHAARKNDHEAAARRSSRLKKQIRILKQELAAIQANTSASGISRP
jgi:hypothetical protein